MYSSVKFLSPRVIAGLPLPGWPLAEDDEDAVLARSTSSCRCYCRTRRVPTASATASRAAMRSVPRSVRVMSRSDLLSGCLEPAAASAAIDVLATSHAGSTRALQGGEGGSTRSATTATQIAAA